MELVQDLFLTAVVAVFFSLVIAKLVSMAMGGDSSHDSHSTPNENVGLEITEDVDEEVIMEELQFRQRLELEGFKTESRAEFVEGVTEKVEFVTDSVPVNQNGMGNTELGQKSIEEEEEKTIKEVVENKGGEFEEKEMNLENRVSEELAVNDKVIVVGQQSEEVKSETKEETEERKIEIGVDDDEDDWEGIERSELEKVFADSAKFVESKEKDESFGSDVQMELHGLYKVATEGPCHQPPPMAILVSARAKWY